MLMIDGILIMFFKRRRSAILVEKETTFLFDSFPSGGGNDWEMLKKIEK